MEPLPLKGILKPGPSLVFNNLVVNGSTAVYAHAQEVVAASLSSLKPGARLELNRVVAEDHEYIHSVAVCYHKQTAYVVLGTEGGVQIWDASLKHVLFVWKNPEATKPTSAFVVFARGIGSIVAGDGSFCIAVGSSTGSVFVFQLANDGKFYLSTTLSKHKTAICAVSSSYHCSAGASEMPGLLLVTGDEDGSVYVWEASSSKDFKFKLEISVNSPCSSIAVRGETLIVGRLDGVVQLRNLVTGGLQYEIVAHSRFLTAMALNPKKDLLATASEDATVNVWALPSASDKAITATLSVCWLNAPITGVAFCGPSFGEVAAVAYDIDELATWKL